MITEIAAAALLTALRETPCIGCGVRFGDARPEADEARRGCVNCKRQRQAIVLAEALDLPQRSDTP